MLTTLLKLNCQHPTQLTTFLVSLVRALGWRDMINSVTHEKIIDCGFHFIAQATLATNHGIWWRWFKEKCASVLCFISLQVI